MKKSRIAIAAICFGLFLPAGVASAAPQENPGSEERTAAIAYYAENEGIPIQDAGNVIDDQAAILSAANDLGFDFDDTESVRFEPDGATQVAFVRSDSNAHIAGITSVQVSVNTTIVVENGDANSDVSLEVSDATVGEVKDIVPSVQGIYVRESDGALMIDAAPAADGVQARSSVQAIKVSGYSTAVVNYSGVASDSLSIRGGTGMSSCTAGFPAKYGSYKGFISAAHCPDSTRLFANTAGTGTSTAATMRKQIHNGNADIAFYGVAGSNTLTNTRYASSSSSAVRVGTPMDVGPGTVACHRGKTKGYKCGTISSIAYKPTYSGACPGGTCNSVFVRVTAEQAGGDTGGPWSAGSSPIGIHKGGSTTFSIYSKLYRTPSGVSIQY